MPKLIWPDNDPLIKKVPRSHPLYSRYWARLKSKASVIKLQNSATHKGMRWENWFAEKIGGMNINNPIMNRSFDVLANGAQFNVKSCELYKRKIKRGKVCSSIGWWVFPRNKGSCDFYACICLEGGKPTKLYIVPANKTPMSGLTIGYKTSKYESFRVAY